MNDPDEEFYEPPKRTRTGKVIVVVALAAALALVGLAAEKRYHVLELAEQRANHPLPEDPRVGPLLAEGERALVVGELDAAQGAFDKASVLSDHDPRVLLGVARVDAAKADVPWLKLRLISPDAADDVRTLKSELAERAALAQRAAQEALTAAPDDPQAIRAKIDALRIAGELEAAHAYVVAVFGQASRPETAYVLGALELAQLAPPWPSVTDRLRLASGSEWSTGRARAALVYALTRSGDLAGARTEMAKLDSMPRPYPCIPQLRALLAMVTVDAGAGAAADAAVDAAPARLDAAAVAAMAAAGGAPAGGGGGGGGGAPTQWYTPGEPTDNKTRAALLAASEAMAVRDYSKAEQIFNAILAADPSDSQAIGGLGDIARARGDTQGAITAYRRAVAVNSSYLPALLGLADTQWARGDHPAAVSVYRNIEEHFPDGSYPEYVKQRASGGQ